MRMISAREIRLGATAFAAAAESLIGINSGPLAAVEFLYQQTNLTSNQPRVARNTDPNLQNAWGVTFLPASVFPGGSPFWVSDNNSGLSTLYNATGMLVAPPVNIPSPSADTGGTPTGVVANLPSLPHRPGSSTTSSSSILKTARSSAGPLCFRFSIRRRWSRDTSPLAAPSTRASR